MKHPNPIQISIPQPCHEDWNKMTPQEQGRFCDSCQKCVVDLTNFSDAELYQYLLENKGKKACGRFRAEQLNRPIQIVHQPHSQLYKWIIAAGLTLIFASNPDTITFARVPFTTTVQDVDTPEISGRDKKKDKHNTDSIRIRGHVMNIDDDTPIINAQVKITKNNRVVAGAITDSKGHFELSLSKSDTAIGVMIVNYIGHDEYRVPVSALMNQPTVTVYLTPWETAVFGGFDIIVIDSVQIDKYDGGHTKTIKSDEIEKGAY